MTATGSSRPVAEPTRRHWAAVIALAIAAGSLLTGGSAVRADQTVFFDEAGNAPHISLIGDSTLTGVRWYADYGALERFNFVLSAESCRRTIEQSCISREGYRPANVIMAMRTLDGELGEVLVVMSGYNDPGWTIDEAIARVVDEARSKDVGHVVWLSLRTSDDVDYSDPQEQSSINTFREYNEQLFEAAAASEGYLQVADWATYSNGASAWFEADGVHLTGRGVDAITTFITGTVERVLAGENVSPAAAPWTVLVPGAEGEIVEAVQEALIAAGVEVPGGADGVYGNDTMAAVAAYQRRQRWPPGDRRRRLGDGPVARRVRRSRSRQRGLCAADDDRRRHDRARAGAIRRCRRDPRTARHRRRAAPLAARRRVGGRRARRRRGGPPAVRRRPARRPALGTRPPGDVAPPECRRHATCRRTPDDGGNGSRGLDLRP